MWNRRLNFNQLRETWLLHTGAIFLSNFCMFGLMRVNRGKKDSYDMRKWRRNHGLNTWSCTNLSQCKRCCAVFLARMRTSSKALTANEDAAAASIQKDTRQPSCFCRMSLSIMDPKCQEMKKNESNWQCCWGKRRAKTCQKNVPKNWRGVFCGQRANFLARFWLIRLTKNVPTCQLARR